MLRIELRPDEEFMVNGALLRADTRRVKLRLISNARLLRARDILREEDAITPEQRVYLHAMQLYQDGGSATAREQLAHLIVSYSRAYPAAPKSVLDLVLSEADAGRFYRALQACKSLLPPDGPPARPAARRE